MDTPLFRIEHDLLRDRENFAITGTAISIYPEPIKTLTCFTPTEHCMAFAQGVEEVAYHGVAPFHKNR